VLEYVDIVDAQTRRSIEVARRGRLDADVPSCPGWSLADLTWHLTEVQSFWAAIVEGLLDAPDEVTEPQRPPDEELIGALDAARHRLVEGLASADPEDACWTWSADKSVHFVRRRQAHEALIHRVDFELSAGVELVEINPALAADGVDEVLRVMIGGVPDWGTFTPEVATMRLVAEDVNRAWPLQFGRFTGTSPNTGNTYDLDAVEVMEVGRPEATVSGRAADLDLWLWGRGPVERLTTDGDPALAGRLRLLAVEDTQ